MPNNSGATRKNPANNANAKAVLNGLANTGKNLAALNAKVTTTLKNAGVVGEEARATIEKMNAAENMIRQVREKTAEATRRDRADRRARYNHKLAAFMKVRDPSRTYTQPENNALRNRAGQAVYGKGQSLWNTKTHRAPEWNRMGGGRRKGS
jgi:hypothetical protein